MAAFRFQMNNGGQFLIGSRGADTIEGSAGADMLFGGIGADTFRFGQGHGQDTILDFDAAAGDLLRFDASERTVSYIDTADGLLISDGALGGGGANSVLLYGVHAIDPSAFAWADTSPIA